MSGTMSSASSDWLQFYQPGNLSDQPSSTAARGWTSEIATDAAANIITSTTTSTQLGRVNRTNTRRRSRASRRTPTTLVNTDTTNFRAMVQQFTGGAGAAGVQTAPSFIPGNGSGNQYLGGYNNNNSANLSFGLGPTSSVMAAVAAPAGGYNLQFRRPLGGGGGGQQYYQGEQHQAFLQSLQNYTSSGPTGDDVGPSQGRGSSSNIETGQDTNSYVF